MDAANLIVDLYYQVQDLKRDLSLAEARLEQSQEVISALTEQVMAFQEAPFRVTMTLNDGTQKSFEAEEAERIVGEALEFYGPTWADAQDGASPAIGSI